METVEINPIPNRFTKALKDLATTALVGLGGIVGGASSGYWAYRGVEALNERDALGGDELFKNLTEVGAGSITSTIVFATSIGIACAWRLNEDGLTESEVARGCRSIKPGN